MDREPMAERSIERALALDLAHLGLNPASPYGLDGFGQVIQPVWAVSQLLVVRGSC